jgi:hypothetical protein
MILNLTSYSLDLKCPQKLCVENLVSSLWCSWKAKETFGYEPSGKKLGYCKHALKGDIWTEVTFFLSPFLCFLTTMSEQSPLPHILSYDVLPHHRHKTMEPDDCGWKFLKP